MATTQKTKAAFDAVRGTSFKFDPATLVQSSFTGRKYGVTDEAVLEMAKSFILEGQLQDIGIRKGFNDEPVIIFGNTRYKAGLYINKNKKWAADFAKENNVPFSTEETFLVRATYFKVNEEEAALMTLLENDPQTRTPVSAIDTAFMIRELTTKYGYSDADVARRMNKLPSEISNLQKLLTLPSEIQKQVASGEMKVSQALTVAKIEPSQRTAAIQTAKANNGGKLTAAGLTAAAREIGAETKGKTTRSLAELKLVLKPIADGATSPEKVRALAIWDFLAGRGTDQDLIAALGNTKKASA